MGPETLRWNLSLNASLGVEFEATQQVAEGDIFRQRDLANLFRAHPWGSCRGPHLDHHVVVFLGEFSGGVDRFSQGELGWQFLTPLKLHCHRPAPFLSAMEPQMYAESYRLWTQLDLSLTAARSPTS